MYDIFCELVILWVVSCELMGLLQFTVVIVIVIVIHVIIVIVVAGLATKICVKYTLLSLYVHFGSAQSVSGSHAPSSHAPRAHEGYCAQSNAFSDM